MWSKFIWNLSKRIIYFLNFYLGTPKSKNGGRNYFYINCQCVSNTLIANCIMNCINYFSFICRDQLHVEAKDIDTELKSTAIFVAV